MHVNHFFNKTDSELVDSIVRMLKNEKSAHAMAKKADLFRLLGLYPLLDNGDFCCFSRSLSAARFGLKINRSVCGINNGLCVF